MDGIDRVASGTKTEQLPSKQSERSNLKNKYVYPRDCHVSTEKTYFSILTRNDPFYFISRKFYCLHMILYS